MTANRTVSTLPPNLLASGRRLQQGRLAGLTRRLALTLLAAGCLPAAETDAPTPARATVTPRQDREPMSAGPADHPWISFSDGTAQSGIDFVHRSGTSPEKPFPATNGSGIAAADFDLDGRQDLYFATGTQFPIDAGGGPTNRLYRNAGRRRFVAADAAGLDRGGFTAGLAVSDYDADGFPDIYLACYGENRLFRNEGDGTFVETSECRDDRWATSAAFFDADGDGLPDLYVCNYGKWTPETAKYCGDPDRGVRIYCNPRTVEPEPHVFYRNLGDGGFEEASRAFGFAVAPGRGQGVVAADLNGDSRTDLYVANDQNPNFLFLANADGTFRDATEQSGAAYDFRGEMQAGMGIAVGDFDADGRFDLFVTNYEGEPNTLYRQAAGEVFNDVSRGTGLAAPSLPQVGWGTTFADFDFDGRPDLVVTNGHTDDNLHELDRDGVYEQPPFLFRNVGGRFEERGSTAGKYFSGRHVGRALALIDADDDFAPDLVIGHQDGPPALLLRDGAESHPARVRIRLVGRRGNRDAVGAVVTAVSGNIRQTLPISGGGSYLSASDPRLLIAAPDGPVDLTIRWPWSGEGRVAKLDAGGDYLVIEPAAPADPPRLLRLDPTSSYREEVAHGRPERPSG